MSDIELALPVHRRVTLLKDKMTAQNTTIWTEGNTPDYASGTHCALVSGDSLTSKKSFESGVLSFYAKAADWTDVVMGFRLTDNEDEIIYENDDFVSEANNLGAITSNAVLADGTAYFFKIIWCMYYVSIQVWTLAGVETVELTVHRNPTNKAMNLFFTSSTTDALDIANVSVLEADDSVFFLEEAADPVIRQSNWCLLQPSGGAVWTTRRSIAILFGGGDDGHTGRGQTAIHRREDYTPSQWRIRYYYTSVGADCYPKHYLGDAGCGDNLLWNRASNVNILFAASGGVTVLGCATTPWYAYTEEETWYIYWALVEAGQGADIYLHGALVEWE